MKKIFFFTLSALFVLAYSCNEKAASKDDQTILKGKVTILVDETILPIIEDQVQVFESQYNAKITLLPKSETEIVQALMAQKNNLAIVTRNLTKSEESVFTSKKITPKITDMAFDGIAFITNKTSIDTIIDLEKIKSFIQGKETIGIKGLVFDNPNSSTVRIIKEISKVTSLPKENIFSFATNNEVITFVAKNPGMIGVVGVNWLSQPMPEMQKVVDDIQVMYVKTATNSVKPTQENLGSGDYPVFRKIKMLNYQGFSGLGMGFASFIAGETGQRIVLKSGLIPIRYPSRNLNIRSTIEKKN